MCVAPAGNANYFQMLKLKKREREKGQMAYPDDTQSPSGVTPSGCKAWETKRICLNLVYNNNNTRFFYFYLKT